MKAQDIRKIAVAGAGTMGASMAQIFAKYGYTVVLYDIAEAALERGRNLVKVNQARGRKAALKALVDQYTENALDPENGKIFTGTSKAQ